MKRLVLLLSSIILSFAAIAQSVLSFDGVNDYVNLGPTAGNNVRTVEFWFKLDNSITSSLSNFKMLCSREVNSSNTNEWHVSFTIGSSAIAGSIRFAVIPSVGNTTDIISDTNHWNANQWYHVAAVIHPSQGMMLFIDGVKQRDTEPNFTSATASMTQDLEIGRQAGFSRHFEGDIDDFHLASTALYTASFSPQCPDRSEETSTIGLWNFNESGGNIAIDSSAQQMNAIINGALRDTSIVCGRKGQTSLSFDGINDHINLGQSIGNNVRTVECWFKLTNPFSSSQNAFKMICMRDVSGNNANEWHLSFTPNGTSSSTAGALRFSYTNASGINFDVESDTTSWNANQWYHVAGVIHPIQGMMLFIDGAMQSDIEPNFNSPTFTIAQDLEIARHRGFSRYFEGNIEDFHLASTALYSSNFTPPCPGRTPVSGTIGLWNFNESFGAIAHDAGPLQNDVFINGASWDSSFVCPGQPVGFEELNANANTSELEVYPNPTDGILYLSDANDIILIRIYNSNGQLIQEINQLNENRIQLPEQKGLYFMRIKKESGEILQKKVVRR